MQIENILKEYQALELEKAIDYEKFNLYSITNHSTAIEGNTLSENETIVLLENGLTPKGKPIEHSLMTKDHFEALTFTINAAIEKQPVSSELIKKIGGMVMRSTGKSYNTIMGSFDTAKGDFRKMKVFVGKSSFPDFKKIPELINEFCSHLNKEIHTNENSGIKIQLKISFKAHLNFVLIHPFADGNGRTARLITNYVQKRFNLPLSIVFKEDKVDYFNVIQEAREKNDISIFYNFMFSQYEKQLINEINNYKNKSKGFSFLI